MSETKATLQVPGIGDDSRDHPYRRSLQPKAAIEAPILRHTQSQNYGAKKKKVVKVPTIPEASDGEVNVSVMVENEMKTEKEKKHRHSRGSRKSSQASRLGVDNGAFQVEDGLKMSRGNSAASSVRSSMRDPSVQSLTVVREQYCCYAKWSPCERALFAAVCVLSFIVIVLVVVVVLVAVHPDNELFVNSTVVVPNGLHVRELYLLLL